MPSSDLTKLTPPLLNESERRAFFQHFFRRLAAFRNASDLYAETESVLSSDSEEESHRTRDAYKQEVGAWAQELLNHAWVACQLEAVDKGNCPTLDPYAETSTAHLPAMPLKEDVSKLLNTILFLHVTTAKQYSARTRAFLWSIGTLDEHTIVATLKNPEEAVKEAEKKTQRTKENHAERGKVLRWAGVGLGAVAGGLLVGVTGGLAAPLVGAGVTSILGFLGVGGSAVGLLASGLAGSSVVCGALFGAYGARSSANMVSRYTKEVEDLAIVPVHTNKEQETMAVRLCVSGWLDDRKDVVAPWAVFEGDDSNALQWEVQALENLANALSALVKTQAMQWVQVQIIKQTVLAALMSALSPVAWLKVGKIIDNPWMQAKQLAIKTGAVLGELLASRVFGNRPVTLCGYSLGSLVIFEALKHLTTLAPSQTAHLIQDVFLFGSPVPSDETTWSAVRRAVCGRLVNGYAKQDYILAVLSRASDANWGVAGLQAVQVQGVQNVECDVGGHKKWRGLIGRCLRDCGVPGVNSKTVDSQLADVAVRLEEELEASAGEAQELKEKGTGHGVKENGTDTAK